MAGENERNSEKFLEKPTQTTTAVVYGNIVTSHALVPGSIPGRVSLLVEFYSGVFPQP